MLRLLLVSGHLENETAVSLPGSCWTGVWDLLLQGFDFLYRAMKSSVYGLCHVFESRWAYLQLYPKEHQLYSAEDCG
jgi:hypothetical protein